jgi:hypothetical protein
VNLAGYDNIRRNTLAARIGALDHSNLLATSRLNYLRIYTPLCYCDDYSATNNAYYKAYLVEVIDIRLDDPILRDCIAHEVKLGLNNS